MIATKSKLDDCATPGEAISFSLSSSKNEGQIITFTKSPLAIFDEIKSRQEVKTLKSNIDNMYFVRASEEGFAMRCLEESSDSPSHFRGDICFPERRNFQEFLGSLPDVSSSSEASEDETENSSVDDPSRITKINVQGKELSEVCGLEEAKRTLFNTFIYPSLYPHLFPENIRWNRILLYGPPGTGKSMLAKAIAKGISATFHKISSADLLSHWQGETEKNIRALFLEIKSAVEPNVIFFDEIDGICRARSSSESDSVRRIKTELLIQLEEIGSSKKETMQTFILGATNCPWDIDAAFLRRFHKKVYIPLPDKSARINILRKGLEKTEVNITEEEWNEVGNLTEGYSGSDLTNIAMAACTERFFDMMNCKNWIKKGTLWVPAPTDWLFSTRVDFHDIPRHQIGSRGINFGDLSNAISSTTKTISKEELKKYQEYSLIR